MSSWNTPRQVIFPRSFDRIVRLVILLVVLGGGYVTALVAFGASPKTLAVGYAPEQPIPYSHELHVGELGLDCRYCHTTVDEGPYANIPPSQTCLNCHAKILNDSEKLAWLWESRDTGRPIPWVKVHDLPDYAFFNHSAHVTRGVGCVSCHGRVDTMEVVRQVEPLSMSWCLDCHRYPERNLRPPEEATNMAWTPGPEDFEALGGTYPEDAPDEASARYAYGQLFKEVNDILPPTDCSTCHR